MYPQLYFGSLWNYGASFVRCKPAVPLLLIGGCIGGAIGGAVVYFTDLAALGFGTTVVPGIALADPANNGYVNYIIAHVIALAAGFLFAFVLGIGFDRKKTSEAVSNTTAGTGSILQKYSPGRQTL